MLVWVLIRWLELSRDQVGLLELAGLIVLLGVFHAAAQKPRKSA